MREHLKKFHLAAAEHHVALGKIHQRLSAAHTETSDEIANLHKEAAAAHVDRADFHLRMAKSLEGAPDTLPSPTRETHTDADAFGSRDFRAAKAAGNPWQTARAFEKAVPTRAQAVIGPAPGSRLVPRTGGPTPADADLDIEKVDPALRDLVKAT